MRKGAKIALFLLLTCFFFPTAGGGAPAKEESEEESRKAEQLYNAGYFLTLMGRYQEAIRLFEKSLEIRATAEAYTYMGWTHSHMGDLQRAIEEAQMAIRIDPDFGNPYNDIGVYLIELGKEDEAIPYLEQAVRAKRYCCYQFPHYNLGRIYLKKKMLEKAREEFKKSLAVDPNYSPALEALELLQEFLEESGLKET